MDYSKVVGAFYVGIRAGLIDEKHYQKMGNSIWLFMWCVHRQTSVHEGRGIVLRGQAITYELIHAETGYAIENLRKWLRVLKRGEYVATKFCGNGFQIRVLGQKKSKVRVGKTGHPRVGKTGQAAVKSSHPSPVAPTKDRDLNSPPNCPNILQDNTTAASLKTLAVSLKGLAQEKKIPRLKISEKEIEQRRQMLLRQAEELREKFAAMRPV